MDKENIKGDAVLTELDLAADKLSAVGEGQLSTAVRDAAQIISNFDALVEALEDLYGVCGRVGRYVHGEGSDEESDDFNEVMKRAAAALSKAGSQE